MDFSDKTIKRVGDSIHVMKVEAVTDEKNLKKAIKAQIATLESNIAGFENGIVVSNQKIKDLKKLLKKVDEVAAPEIINEQPQQTIPAPEELTTPNLQ